MKASLLPLFLLLPLPVSASFSSISEEFASGSSREDALEWLSQNNTDDAVRDPSLVNFAWSRPSAGDASSFLLAFPVAPLPGRSFFFGDSLSDTGNVSDVLGGLGPGYPGTSFTNGTTWVGYLEPDALRILDTIEFEIRRGRFTRSGLLPGDPISVAVPPRSRPPYGSTDFSAGGATTQTILDQQIKVLFENIVPNNRDRAFIWGGGNDFLDVLAGDTPPTEAQIGTTIATGVANLTESVGILSGRGIQDITVISLLNIGLAPRADGFEEQGAGITGLFNTTLKQSLKALAPPSRLLWVDSNAILNDAFANPAAYGLTNLTDPAAPQARDGVPSTLSPEEQNTYFFYDDIHPTTAVHEQFARFVTHHLTLERDSESVFLVTDAALALDDRFGFENEGLTRGESDFQVSTFYNENQSGSSRRNTTGIRADLDFAVSNQIIVGGEFFYSEGDASRSEFEATGFGLDATYQKSLGKLDWETGIGAGAVWGDLTREYSVGSFSAESEQDAKVLTAHTALRNSNWTVGGLDAYWEIGLKQRFVRQNSATESGAASLDLSYSGESLHTTIANLEMGLSLNSKLDLEFSLNPVLYHDGGSAESRQSTGLATFSTSDLTGYDVHTARASLIWAPTDSSAITTDFVIGSEDTWSANLGYRLRF